METLFLRVLCRIVSILSKLSSQYFRFSGYLAQFLPYWVNWLQEVCDSIPSRYKVSSKWKEIMSTSSEVIQINIFCGQGFHPYLFPNRAIEETLPLMVLYGTVEFSKINDQVFLFPNFLKFCEFQLPPL